MLDLVPDLVPDFYRPLDVAANEIGRPVRAGRGVGGPHLRPRLLAAWLIPAGRVRILATCKWDGGAG